jgi:hypothetical protein
MLKPFLTVVLLALASPVAAQTVATITSYEIQAYLTGVDPQAGGQPLQVSAVPLAVVTCDQAITATPPGTIVNPRFVVWHDASSPLDVNGVPTRLCQADRSAFMLALPVGTGYRLTITALAAGGLVSARSNTSGPFAVSQLPPAARTGLGVRP